MQYKTPIIHDNKQHTPLALGTEELAPQAIPVSAAENNIITKNEDGLFATLPIGSCPSVPPGFTVYYQSGDPFGKVTLGLEFTLSLNPDVPVFNLEYSTEESPAGTAPVWSEQNEGVTQVSPGVGGLGLVAEDVEVASFTFNGEVLSIGAATTTFEGDIWLTPVGADFHRVADAATINITKVSTGEAHAAEWSEVTKQTNLALPFGFIEDGERYCLAAEFFLGTPA